MPFDMTNVYTIGEDVLMWGSRIVLMVVILGTFYAIAFFINKKKKYQWTVRIFNKDATGNVIQQPDDKAAIVLDKRTQYRLFMLKKNKFGLDPDDIPYILTSRGGKIVYLLQTGLKNFQFMRPQMSDNPGLLFNVQDEDVAWAINAWERYKNPYKNQFLEKILPFIGMAFVFLLTIAAIYFIFTKAGLNAELLRELSVSAQSISDNMAKASLGTVVVD